MRGTLEERFWAKVKVGNPEDCWEWQGSRYNRGHGQFYMGGGRANPTKTSAQRVAWELVNGPIPRGMFVCHHCDNPPCCNPKHLFVGTSSDNMRDMAAKGRAAGWPPSAHEGRKQTPEAKAKISAANKGRVHSDEVRARMSAGQKGRVFPPETRVKISEALRGRQFSPETRAKLSEAQRRRWQRTRGMVSL